MGNSASVQQHRVADHSVVSHAKVTQWLENKQPKQQSPESPKKY